MAEEPKDGVKVEEQAAPVATPAAETATPNASEGVKTQDTVNYQELYQKAQEEAENKAKALKEAREKEKAEREARIALEAQMQSQQYQAPTEDNDEAVRLFYENKAKTDLLFLAQTDPFVKDNLQLVAQELANNPLQGADTAATRVKASIMDGIIKSAEVVKPEAPTTPTPGAVPESQSYDQLSGDEDNVIAQMEAKLKGIR